MQMTLAAEARDERTGKSVARKLRRDGRIPAVVYARGSDARPITVDPKALLEVFRKTQDKNTIINLEIEGDAVPALVREAQRHPLKRDLLHVDFYALEPGQVVEVMVPVRGVGRAAGMAIGGRLRLIRREVRVRCEWTKIPAALEVDITPMQIGDMVKASEIPLPEGVELVLKHDFNVLTIYGKRASSKKEK
jgi:large subunit ribosomal protein L25